MTEEYTVKLDADDREALASIIEEHSDTLTPAQETALLTVAYDLKLDL
jgi:hypothetical protein